MSEEIKQAMEKLAKQLRSAAHWCDDGYYTTELDSAVNSAKRGVYEEIASAIDNAFDVNSSMSRLDWKNAR